MRQLHVVVPSRGRPHNIARLIERWCDTAHGNASLSVVVDDDDPTLDSYGKVVQGSEEWLTLHVGPRLGLAGSLNAIAMTIQPRPQFIGFMGDDHVPQTFGWDSAIINALSEPQIKIVYGDDKLQGANLPTAVFMRTAVIDATGYFCPPGMRHMYLDNCWLEWGRGSDSLCYLPDVVIEHMHPCIGKGTQDALYAETSAMMSGDQMGYNAYVAEKLHEDVAKIKGL